MGYCTKEDLIARFGEREIQQLSDKGDLITPHDEGNEVNDARVSVAIDDASSEMDSYLSRCYDIPELRAIYLAGGKVPRLVALCSDISRFRLYDTLKDEDHEAYRRYKAAKEELKNICSVSLFDNDGESVDKGSAVGSSIIVEDRPSIAPDTYPGSYGIYDHDYGLI